MTPVRRRGLLLLSFALVCGGLAASQVRERERRAEAAVGPLVPALVATGDLSAGRRVSFRDLAVRHVPARFAPPDSLAAPREVAGARLAVPVAAGAYVTAPMVGGAEPRGEAGALRPGERAVELAVAGEGALAAAELGAHVDVLITVQRDQGTGRTFVALEDVELLGLRTPGGDEVGAGGDEVAPDGGEPGAAAVATALATLRVTARQAVYLAAAANFAQEIRLLVRPPGDRRHIGTSAVDEGGL
jgi:pilus assembly protein CpaB